MMKLLLFSFFLKREEEDKEEEETLEMIALPLCLLRFVRVRALAVVVALVGGIDDDDNIFYLHSLFCFCVTFFWRERERFFFVSEHSRPKFSFFVSFALFSFVVGFAPYKVLVSLAFFLRVGFFLSCLGREEDSLPYSVKMMMTTSTRTTIGFAKTTTTASIPISSSSSFLSRRSLRTTFERRRLTMCSSSSSSSRSLEEEEVVQRAMRSLMRKKSEEEEKEGENVMTRLDEYARTLVEASSWSTGNQTEEEDKEEEDKRKVSSSSSLLATSFALDALVLSRMFTLMRKREPPGSETMGIARQIVNISFLGLDTRTLRIRDWPRGTAIFDVQPKECNEYLTPRMKLMNAKVTRGSSLRRVDFDFMNVERKSLDKKTYLEDALRKEGFREETPTIWICEDLEELIHSEATKMSDFVEEICDLMSRESECCGSAKGVDARLQNTIKALFAANGAMCSFTEEENGCVLFSAIKMRRSAREEEYYRNALMDALEEIDEDGWED